jgi:AcrR family transcriptional regulator
VADTVEAAAQALSGRQAQIAEAARALLDAEGPEALTMRRIAGLLGIKAPSLYKHVPGKAALEALVVAAGFAELAGALAAAADGPGQAGGVDRVVAIAGAYRAFAVTHPYLYRLMNYQPLRRDLLPAGLEARAAQPLAQAAGHDEARARAMWAFAHGMVSLEIDGRFPPQADLDEAWRSGLAAFAPPALAEQTGHAQRPARAQVVPVNAGASGSVNWPGPGSPALPGGVDGEQP